MSDTNHEHHGGHENGGEDENEHTLKPIEPSTAVEMYLDDRKAEWSTRTVQARRYELEAFVEWCEGEGFDDLNDVTGRDLHRFRQHRSEQMQLNTLHRQIINLRKFVRFCESIDGIQEGTAERMMLPGRDRQTRDKKVDEETAYRILEWLDKFHYATRNHAIFRLLWRTGMRTGAACAIDVGDVEEGEGWIELHHRPDEGTPLKNGEHGERVVTLDDETVTVLTDYIAEHRIKHTDEHGRRPLITTHQGRISKSALQRHVYRLTQPCRWGDTCPHDRDPSECKAATKSDSASLCPSAKSPHPLRRGSITYWLKQDVPSRAVSDRMDVGEEVLKQHYDARTEEEKADMRRQYFD